MNQAPYPFTRFADRYIFTSVGKKNISKAVEFNSLNIAGLFNLCFGDVRKDDSIDDEANSNNGDLRKVLSTVVDIIIDFTNTVPRSKIFFTGSTPSRTALYYRILKTYHADFKSTFIISGLIRIGETVFEVDFDPEKGDYIGFFLERKV